MAIYRLIQDSDRYDSLVVPEKHERQKLDGFDGRPIGRSWRPIEVEVVKGEKSGDFPSLLRKAPVFTERALKALQPVIESSVEVLPLSGPGEPLFAINVVDVANCLDHGESEIERLPSGGVMSVEKYVFKHGCLRGKHIFKLPETAVQEVLVDDEFKMLVERNGLKGITFRMIAD